VLDPTKSAAREERRVWPTTMVSIEQNHAVQALSPCTAYQA